MHRKHSNIIVVIIVSLVFVFGTYALVNIIYGNNVLKNDIQDDSLLDDKSKAGLISMEIMLPNFYLEESSKRDKVYLKLENFKASHHEVERIDVDTVQWEQIIPKYEIAFSAGEAPDIVMLNEFSIRPNIINGRLYPLNDHISKEVLDDWEPEYLKIASLAGKVYGYIRNTDIRLIYYNKDIFKKAGLNAENVPKTWDELVEYAKITNHILGPGQYGYGFIGAKTIHTPMMWSILVLQQGADIVEESGKAIFDNSESVKAARFYSDLIHKYKVTPKSVLASDESMLLRDFVEGRYAMIMGGSWQYRDMKNQGNVDFNKIGWCRIPVNKGDRSITLSGFWAFCISSQSQNTSFAYDLLASFANEKDIKEEAIQEGWIPTRISWYDDPKVNGDAIKQGWAEYFREDSRVTIRSNYSFDLYGVLTEALQQIWDGAPAEKTLKEAAESFNHTFITAGKQ